MRYAAHSDWIIYGVGNSEKEALDDCLLYGADIEDMEVSPCSEALYQRVLKDGHSGEWGWEFGADKKTMVLPDEGAST